MAKKNLLKVPQLILDRIASFDQDDVVAATVKLVLPGDLRHYAHLGISFGPDGLVLPDPSPPNPEAGRYSNANLYGLEKVRRDLPKISKNFGFWAPSWNSGSYHYVSHSREVYPREFLPPKEVNLSITYVGERGEGKLLKFAVDQVINRRTPNFERELLYNLNLLQENVGAADVFVSTASIAEYAASVRVDWQILPPGTVDEVLEAMVKGKRPVTEHQQTIMRERVSVLNRLKPEAYVTGSDGMLRYFGAKFGDDFVVFENVRYGNALYIMYEGWEEMSRKSRVELLAGNEGAFDRIIHKDGWADQLRGRVQGYRARKRRQGQLV